MTKSISLSNCDLSISCAITSQHNRLKQYKLAKNENLLESVVYLKNKQKFEIELFNPFDEKILAEISLEGEKIPNNIILKPGERIYLDSRLDEKKKKFIFKSLKVNKNLPSNLLKHNGKITISYFKLKQNRWNEVYIYPIVEEPVYIPYPQPYLPYIPSFPNSAPIWYSSSGEMTGEETNIQIQNNVLTGFKSNDENVDNMMNIGIIEESKTKSNSEISFLHDQRVDFSADAEYTYRFQLIPIEEKILEGKDLRSNCIKCGKKLKKKDQFCSRCGKKV